MGMLQASDFDATTKIFPFINVNVDNIYKFLLEYALINLSSQTMLTSSILF